MTPSPADKLTVHRGSPPSNRYVWSPFVTKLEARLRFDGVAYRLGAGSPRSAPKGKIPYVDVRLDDGEHDETRVESLADSTLIIRALVQRGMLHDVNAGLQPAQRAHDLAVRAMLEDRVYFYGSREKWRDNYYAMRAHVLAAVPWPLQVLVGWLAYRGVESGLHGQGTGRLEHEEVQTLKLEVWESINALLVEARRSAGSGPDDRHTASSPVP
ncbi:hypothetical protein HIM_03553 [Hirsutella minnesotensis 3608]|uniref:Thioredoxin-like fold domain-containing protein n=1 Tax=Hirsutella minnesotensis 3608 TaxID=1043627 RepID=A0A0F8A2S4_9HYPO|nr:hypothetical protein HIM_03553 [Hirsutella minnesotensis 3608]